MPFAIGISSPIIGIILSQKKKNKPKVTIPTGMAYAIPKG
jgi:hypothetical protein